MRPDLSREVCRWLAKARTDLDAAMFLMGPGRRFPTVAAFLCQQTAEKSLKAYLTSKETPFAPIHDLRRLRDLCESLDEGFSGFRTACEVLTPYAVSVRYPGEGPDVQEDEAEEAVRLAQSLFDFVASLLPAAG